MPGCRSVLAAAVLVLPAAFPATLRAQESTPAPSTQSPGVSPVSPVSPVRNIQLVGAKELEPRGTIEATHILVGEPLPGTGDPAVPGDDQGALVRLANAVERHYRDEGYPFARAKASFDEATGTLTIAIDEGVIDAVEFQGVNERARRELAADFALRAGDVFNRARAMQALRALLRPTRGALEPGHVGEPAATESSDLDHGRRTFALIDRNGQRVLLVAIRERDGRFRIVPDFGEREDWFTPVDGFAPSLGFGAAVFDQDHFNHTYIAGHGSLRTATSRFGYALGFERPFFAAQRLYIGGEVHDMTATDDTWQVSSLEASLAAIGARRSFRDYYRRRGVQINSAWRVQRRLELLFAWRGERQERLAVASNFSLFNDDEAFRPNLAAQDGRLNAVVIGASVDGVGFERESLEATYRRHQLESPFGDQLNLPEPGAPPAVWRVDWTSEVSSPAALNSDFDFRRHVVSGRLRTALSPHQDVGIRAIGGWSDGVLPPQRQFAIGGIGSVHGYPFKAATGDALALVNLEYGLGWGEDFRVLGFFDAGRATVRAKPGTPPQAVDSSWMKGIGFGVAVGNGFRVDFGYRVDAIRSSPQVLLRFGRTF
jgi:hypothetical protein